MSFDNMFNYWCQYGCLLTLFVLYIFKIYKMKHEENTRRTGLTNISGVVLGSIQRHAHTPTHSHFWLELKITADTFIIDHIIFPLTM